MGNRRWRWGLTWDLAVVIHEVLFPLLGGHVVAQGEQKVILVAGLVLLVVALVFALAQALVLLVVVTVAAIPRHDHCDYLVLFVPNTNTITNTSSMSARQLYCYTRRHTVALASCTSVRSGGSD